LHLFGQLCELPPHFLMAQEVAAIQPAQGPGHFTPKPSIVLQIVFDQLLNIFVHVPVARGRYTVQLRLQFWGEVYFHSFSVKRTASGVNALGVLMDSEPLHRCRAGSSVKLLDSPAWRQSLLLQ